MSKRNLFVLALLTAILFVSCKKESETFVTESINDYAPMQPGKYITYQLDSFRYLPQSLQSIVTSYQAMYVVDSLITDNLGRSGYRIFRYLRNTANDPWVSDATYMAFNTGATYEYVENNLRFVKLKLPIVEGYNWSGNAYINTTSDTTAIYDYNYLDGWDYTYDSIGAKLTLGSYNLDSTLKVAQANEIIGYPNDPTSYSEINFGVEYYAKGIGMVYRKLFHSEYQPPVNGYSGYYSDNSQGATYTMIDHN